MPSDSVGKVCGIDYPKYSFVYFVNPPDIVIVSLYRVKEFVFRIAPNQEARNSVAWRQAILAAVSAKFLDLLFPTMIARNFKVDTKINLDNNGNFCMPTDP